MRRRQETEAIFGENRCFIEWQAIIFNNPGGDWQGTGKNSARPFNKVITQLLYRTGMKINNLPHEPAHMPCNGYGEKNKNPSDSSLLNVHVLPRKLLLGYRDILEVDEFVVRGFLKFWPLRLLEKYEIITHSMMMWVGTQGKMPVTDGRIGKVGGGVGATAGGGYQACRFCQRGTSFEAKIFKITKLCSSRMRNVGEY